MFSAAVGVATTVAALAGLNVLLGDQSYVTTPVALAVVAVSVEELPKQMGVGSAAALTLSLAGMMTFTFAVCTLLHSSFTVTVTSTDCCASV